MFHPRRKSTLGLCACVAATLATAAFAAGRERLDCVHAPKKRAAFDLVIRHGRVIDGTGSPAHWADIGIQNGRIAAIERDLGEGTQEIDAAGMIVAPGFIDVHTHCEDILTLPFAENFVRMGVTSIVTGNCGGSKLEVGKFLAEVDGKTSINVATLIGHNTVRTEAMGGNFNREPTRAELDKMCNLVRAAMKDGAVGLSTGLIYLPGTFSKTDEIIALAKAAAEYKGIYASHMRNEGTELLTSLDELFRIAKEAKIPAEVSHIKCGGKPAWGLADKALEAIEKARADGLDITQDQYLYTASSTGLSAVIPASAREGTLADFKQRLADPGKKSAIVAEMKGSLAKGLRDSYEYAVIASYRTDPRLQGKTVVEAARIMQGGDSLDDQIELILDIHAHGGASAVFHGMSEDDLQKFVAHPNTMIASDAGVRRFGEAFPHPRGYGNNVRCLSRYVRELNVLRLEEAIRRMTSLPAATFRLKDRGVLRVGAWADVVVFDPATVQDTSKFDDPHHYPTGLPHVVVNGVPVLVNGKPTGVTPGRAIRRGE